MSKAVITSLKFSRLRLEFTCSRRCDAPRAITHLVEQAGSGLGALTTRPAGRYSITYLIEIAPRSLDDACAIIEHLEDFGSVSFLPRSRA
jgi:hypothetical protein